jgi:peptide/nickel transport system substrate-binding protein
VTAEPALAQKSGGILKMYSPDSPASMSIHEEATFVAEGPMMGVFNNLVMFDQHAKQNTLGSIVPDLAIGWSWNEDGTDLTFPLRDGVRWHDGKPFTAQDVRCTFDLLTGKSSEKLRVNSRKSWYRNLEAVTTNGDYEVTFHLKRPQPAFLTALAGGYSPIYPCHVNPRDMRSHPIGTGPFKFLEFKPNERSTVTRNPDYWKTGRPYLDGVEYTIIRNLSTATLAFVAGKFDMTFPYSLEVPLLRDIKRHMPETICELVPLGISRSLIVSRDRPPFDNLPRLPLSVTTHKTRGHVGRLARLLSVQREVFEARIIVDAVDHRHKPLELGLPAIRGARIKQDRPGVVLGQLSFNCPDQPFALLEVGLH